MASFKLPSKRNKVRKEDNRRRETDGVESTDVMSGGQDNTGKANQKQLRCPFIQIFGVILMCLEL